MARAKHIKPIDRLYMDKVLESVCIACKCDREQIFEKTRKRETVYKRYLFILTCVNHKPHWAGKYNAMAKYLDLDHATVIHGEIRAGELLETDEIFRDLYNHARLMMDGHLCDPMMNEYKKKISVLRYEIKQRDKSIEKLMERVKYWKRLAEGKSKLFGNPNYN